MFIADPFQQKNRQDVIYATILSRGCLYDYYFYPFFYDDGNLNHWICIFIGIFVFHHFFTLLEWIILCFKSSCLNNITVWHFSCWRLYGLCFFAVLSNTLLWIHEELTSPCPYHRLTCYTFNQLMADGECKARSKYKGDVP